MNKIVLRSMIVMLSLVFGLMVAGCKHEPEEEVVVVVDPSGGKTVEEKYWGTYKCDTDGLTLILSEKKYIYVDRQGNRSECQAWTEGANLFNFAAGYTMLFGIFKNDASFEKQSNKNIYTKASD